MEYRVKIIDDSLTAQEQQDLLDAILADNSTLEEHAAAFLAENTAILSQPDDSTRYLGGAA